MEKQGMVSLWLGRISSETELDELMNVNYSEDGDFVPSKFAQCFSITRYDDATREAEFYEKPQESIEGLLEGFSYDDCIIPKYKEFPIERELTEYNCVILLYNYVYDNVMKNSNERESYFEFVGSVDYMS